MATMFNVKSNIKHQTFYFKGTKKKKKPEAPMLETTNRCAGTQQWNEENLV